MPKRSQKPGFKRGRHGLPYWIASQVVGKDIRGYRDKCIALPRDADEATLAELCRRETARLYAYFDQLDNGGEQPSDDVLLAAYTGTVASLLGVFRGHSMSPFNEVQKSTQKTYGDSLKVIDSSVPHKLIRNLTLIDLKKCYRIWRMPAADGAPERIDRAHDAVQMLRQAVSFGAGVGFKDCAAAIERIKKHRFERGAGRNQEMTRAYVGAFLSKASEMAESGVIAAERALFMSIGVCAQFELGLRQGDVVGKWVPAVLDTPHAVYDAAGEMWVGQFRWDNIPGWRFRLRTSKNKSPSGYLLTEYPLLFSFLDRMPNAERTGAIVKGEHGLPVRARSYRKWYRQIARAADIPDAVWNMDARAGAATEADEAVEGDIALVQDMLTHSDARMTGHYIRRRERANSVVAKARAKLHKQGDAG
jgi:hypothetical protein